jgi:hypothetical protein
MSLKKLGVTLLAVFVMGAIVANSAYAENNWSATTGSWYTGESPGTKLAVGTGTIDLTVSGGAFSLTSTIAGSPIKFESNGVTGINCSATNPTSTSATLDCQFLDFTGVTVSGAAATGCFTPGLVRTKELMGKLGMKNGGTIPTMEISPKAGPTTAFATIELYGTCANAGLYKVTGVVYAMPQNLTGAFGFFQSMSISESIQKSAGTATSLRFGANGAFLNGSITAGAVVGWAGKES